MIRTPFCEAHHEACSVCRACLSSPRLFPGGFTTSCGVAQRTYTYEYTAPICDRYPRPTHVHPSASNLNAGRHSEHSFLRRRQPSQHYSGAGAHNASYPNAHGDKTGQCDAGPADTYEHTAPCPHG
ncbi:MAG: hypothetical protein HY681_08005 [Chloroflexi bacterium]|nr:hypothetical protein [Chloroflexota bacterium]